MDGYEKIHMAGNTVFLPPPEVISNVPFVGREDLIEKTLAALSTADGTPSLHPLLKGPNGTGKTSIGSKIARIYKKDLYIIQGNDELRAEDIACVPAIQKETYLPIIVDPSHATGRRDLIFNMSCASVAAGASGLMIEVHYNPAEALVDAQQQVTPDELKDIIDACQRINKVVLPARNKTKS